MTVAVQEAKAPSRASSKGTPLNLPTGLVLEDSIEGRNIERFLVKDGVLCRKVLRRNGRWSRVAMAKQTTLGNGDVTPSDAEQDLMQSSERPNWSKGRGATVIDLFSGCGGLSVGVGEALVAVGRTPSFLAFDMDEAALNAYANNLPRAETFAGDIEHRIDGVIGRRATRNERAFLRLVPNCDVLVAGPPCQGHSAANNRTRHRDVRNQLYLKAVRAAELLEPEHVIIENVPGAINDRGGVVDRAQEELQGLGYCVDLGVVDASVLGVPQRRRRLVLLASRVTAPSVDRMLDDHALEGPHTVRWAFEDLREIEPRSLFDQPARSAPQTLERIDVLFNHDLYELPDQFRPPCHADGGHSYVSIYGRLRWDEPAQTLTTGFYSMCMGRNVHPSCRRTITAHEAARIQGFPDWFSFDDVTKRVELSRMIGNAVPPRLGYVAALELSR